jgi:hypothetical protein
LLLAAIPTDPPERCKNGDKNGRKNVGTNGWKNEIRVGAPLA